MVSELLEILEASVMALHASEAALFCPATVAVNNDRDVARQFYGLIVDNNKFFVCWI